MELYDTQTISLESMLTNKTVKDLRELAKGCFVKGITKMKKAELVQELASALQTTDRLAELLYIMDANTWEMFRRAAVLPYIIKENSITPACKVLEEFCYIHLQDYGTGIKILVPEEIKAVLTTLVEDGFLEKKRRFDLIHTYAEAAINLYGVISQEDFVALFNLQNAKKTNVEEIFPILLRHIAVDARYCFWKEYIVSIEFEENEFKDVKDLLVQIGNKPRYIPDRFEFLKYAQYDYYEHNEHTGKFIRFLMNDMGKSAEVAEEIVAGIHYACAVEAPTQTIFQILNEYQVNIDTNQLSPLLSLIKNLSNHTRLWSNNGHTPHEIHRTSQLGVKQQVSARTKQTKIGRNDPCPCGSGKKYKKCCGR